MSTRRQNLSRKIKQTASNLAGLTSYTSQNLLIIKYKILNTSEPLMIYKKQLVKTLFKKFAMTFQFIPIEWRFCSDFQQKKSMIEKAKKLQDKMLTKSTCSMHNMQTTERQHRQSSELKEDLCSHRHVHSRFTSVIALNTLSLNLRAATQTRYKIQSVCFQSDTTKHTASLVQSIPGKNWLLIIA